MNRKSSLIAYLLELVIVFIGVFAAFLLNDFQNQQAEDQRKKEIYLALFEDLNRFYEAGQEVNKEGFVIMLKIQRLQLDSMVLSRNIPPVMHFYADYWNIEIIHSLISSGAINDLDIRVVKVISRFHSTHQNFKANIQYFNDFYQNEVTARYSEDMNAFYQPGSNQLKPKYQTLMSYLDILIRNAKTLVDLAAKYKEDIRQYCPPE